MTRNRIVQNILLVAVLALLVGLWGCTTSADTPTASPAPPAAEATATTDTADSAVAPTTAAEATATPNTAGSAAPTTAEATATTDTAGSAAAPTTAAQAAACTKLSLNDITEAQMMASIPNFSSRWVREFLEYRPYVSIQQFRQQLGKYTDQAQITEWEKYVYVPVAPNDSDAVTLQQLPGVDATVAAALIKGRPYASNEAFLTALKAQVSADQLAGAQCYLAATQ